MKRFYLFIFASALLAPNWVAAADETYFFWYGTNPASVSWAPFNWEEQDRSSGFVTTVSLGEFFNHTPDAGEDAQLNRSLTFGGSTMPNIGAHHPTVLPSGAGTVSLWVFYDYTTGLSTDGSLNTIYLSVTPGFDLIKDKYIGVEMIFNADKFKIVSSDKTAGVDGPAIKRDDWNHFVFVDDGASTKLTINDVETSVKLATGGNLRYINIVNGRVKTGGTITDGESMETWYIDDIVCTSSTPSGVAVLDAPLTANKITIDGTIKPEEIAGANHVTWDGSTTERPGVHAQFYGQWQLPTPADMTATAYLQNDGTTLYISIDVVDDVINVTESSSWWEQDSTELYIDHDQNRSTGTVTQVSVRADNGMGNQGDYADWLTMDSKLKADNSGWQVEAAVDMAARLLKQDNTYGFDISINDSDGENEAGFQGAQEWLYASFEDAYENETYWGNLRILSVKALLPDWAVY